MPDQKDLMAHLQQEEHAKIKASNDDSKDIGDSHLFGGQD